MLSIEVGVPYTLRLISHSVRAAEDVSCPQSVRFDSARRGGERGGGGSVSVRQGTRSSRARGAVPNWVGGYT